MEQISVQEMVNDPTWLAHRYDHRSDQIHFTKVTRELVRSAPLLTQLDIPRDHPRRIVSRKELEGITYAKAPLKLIVHSGLTGSTLLTRIFDREGVATCLSEPPILTDLVSCRLSTSSSDHFTAVCQDVLGLLARPFGTEEVVILKAGAVANSLADAILAIDRGCVVIGLNAPLPIYLASIARKGINGRLWARRLFTTLASGRMTDLGFDQKALFEQTDLQIGALVWLALHRTIGGVASRYPDRYQSLESEELFGNPKAAYSQIIEHFGLATDVQSILADEALTRHAKTGEDFDTSRRAKELDEASALHREEIDLIVQWAAKVAESQRIEL